MISLLYFEIKYLNNNLDEIIDISKSFEEQIKLLKKREDLKGYCPYNDEMRDMSNEIDENLFEQIFGHTLVKFADKLINTTN